MKKVLKLDVVFVSVNTGFFLSFNCVDPDLDPDSEYGSGSKKLLNTNLIRIHSTVICLLMQVAKMPVTIPADSIQDISKLVADYTNVAVAELRRLFLGKLASHLSSCKIFARRK